jgi:hypothetical protein
MARTAHLIAFALLLLTVSSAQAKKVWSTKAEKGFLDDVMAFGGENDARFAFIATDAAQLLTIRVLKTNGFVKEAEVKVEPPTVVPKQLAFTPDTTKIVLVYSDGSTGQQGAFLYELPSGALLKKIGPATAATLTIHKGEQAVSLVSTRTDAKNATTHQVQAFRTVDFKKLGAGTVAIGPDQTLKQPPVRLLYFEPGHLHLLGMMKGKYDKKRDLRLPERAVRWSVLARKEVWSAEPKDVLIWVKATNLRPNHPGQLRFVQVSDDLKKLQTVDGDNELGSVSLPIPWKLYEPKSLEQAESWDGKSLWFSMTIDPVNVDAVRRKKADKERVDLYRLDPGQKAAPLGSVLTDKRKFRWTVGGGARYFAYLRKLKGFGRGGSELEVHELGR